MGRNALLPILLFLLIVFDGYNVCLGLELRKLLGDIPKGDSKSAIPDTPSPSRIPGDTETDPEHVGQTNKKETNSPPNSNGANSPAPATSLKMDNRTVNPSGADNKSPARPPTVSESHNDKSDQKENNKGKGNREKSPEKENTRPNEVTGDDKSSEQENCKKNEGITFPQSKANESCGGLSPYCTDQGKMVACISQSGSTFTRCNPQGPKGLVVLVQNGRDSLIKVKLLIDESNCGDIEVPKNQTDKINISPITSGRNNVTLDAGNGKCVLLFGVGTPVTEGNLPLHLPSYDKLLTPINGAYFLIISVIVFGGTWACCKLGKMERHDGVPYQELEMALPESVLATNVETAEGWDQGWDDDWDEDMEAKPSVKHPVGSISANGLTSRSSNKDGWEDDWDD